MNQQDRMHLLAERKFLQERLAELPDSARIMRISTESRLRAIEERLAQEPVDEREPARVRLTFNGRPVIGSHGIFAEFGMKAVSNFTEAVEEASPVAQALERTQNLLQGTVGTDDQLADSAADTDPRALDRVRAFLQTLADYEAICTMQYRDRGFRFTDVGQVRNSLARLGQDNLREDEQYLDGEFQGVLPKGRTFEFKVAGEDEVVRGKVGPVIQDADELNARLHQAARIKVMVTRVGNGRPRYVLIEAPQWAAPV